MNETPTTAKTNVNAWVAYRRLLGYAFRYRGRLALGLLFGLLYGAANGGLMWVLKGGFDSVFDLREISLRETLFFVLLLPVVGLIRGIAEYGSKYLVQWVGNRVVLDLRDAMFAHLNRLSLGYFVQSRTGEIISRISNDTTVVQSSVSTVVEDIAKEPMTIVAMMVYILTLDPMLALISLVLFPVCILPVVAFGRKVRRYARESQQRIADLVSILQESVSCVRVIKAFGMEEYEQDRFHRQNRQFFGRIMKVTRARAAIEPIIVFITTLGFSLLLLYVKMVEMTAGEFITFAGAMVMLYTPVKKLSRVHLQIEQAAASAERIFDVLDTRIEVADRDDATVLDEPVAAISFEQVTFSYSDNPVLRDISLHIPAGTRVALVGGSGAGKTTLVNLLPRFYDPSSGHVLINGRDIATFTLASLRRQIGLVTQDTVLFNDTVANNIAYGTRDASREEIETAAKNANAHDFISAMPDGYDTVIGELGSRLSGGQRQRLAIARAMLRNPPIMVLDEATSALDTESERLVQAALVKLMEGRTVFAIAHRLSTVINSDLILVMDQGRIVESGKHEDLLAAGGLYKKLYDLQFADSAG
ncbi:MAG TPA: ABC transporter transmembrane domain-containing protein [Kiritimatiellia bacterium]|nr:ABC transporter transmembrane domain-containing protein [Kiritimatiellia bacterium]HMO99604.1 ABC transporter transmembrane domain-containing protein [Kiritimatiellia bacterium]HMP97236.1 ABC transporter transmembrane domain-containing protein [Kiritimatiellia bacterium]